MSVQELFAGRAVSADGVIALQDFVEKLKEINLGLREDQIGVIANLFRMEESPSFVDLNEVNIS